MTATCAQSPRAQTRRQQPRHAFISRETVVLGRLASSQLDVIVGNDGAQNELYENDGTGSFTLVTGTSISLGITNTSTIAVLDMDGDRDVRERPRTSKQQRRQQHRRASPLLADMTYACLS